MSTPTLLISGIGKRNALLGLFSQECAEAGVRLMGADAKEMPPARLDMRAFALLPRADDPNFCQAYEELLAMSGARAGFTLVDPEIPLLGDVEENLGRDRFQAMHPPATSARTSEDKFEFARVAARGGIDVFKTSLTPLETYPQICKDRQGSAASGFRVLKNADDLAELPKQGLIFQPFCGGDHYCVDAYFSLKTGDLADYCVKRVLDKHRGESYLLESMPRGRFGDILRAVSKVIPLRGIVNFDFLEDKGTMRMLEINCRIGGNYPASHGFGCNFIRLALQEAFTDQRPSGQLADYPVGQVIAKYFGFSQPALLADVRARSPGN